MKTKLLLFFAFISLCMGAQTTHQLGWGNTGSDANQQITIEVGDTVEWTWGSGSHNLLKTSGPEEFGTGQNYYSGGHVYSHTFELVGANDYVCSPHAGNMNGTITVIETSAPSSDLALQGVIDLNIVDNDYGVNGSQGKAIHVLATADIADLSIYGIGVANNGGGTDGEEYNFESTASATAGDNILVVRSVEAMNAYMDASTIFDQVILGSSSISQNGNDAIELYLNGTIVEVFGDADVNPDTFGAGCGDDVNCWDYEDSWAYKIGGEWTYGGVNCSDGTATTWESTCVYPLAIGQEPVTFTPPTWAGDWILDPVAGALAVGPNAGSVGDWYASSAGDVDTRACLFDDIHRFNADGSYEQVMQDQTWLEGWQGVAEGCGTPVAPHNGSNAATYTYTDTSVTVIGDGAFMGLAKVHNTGEDGVSGGQITYNVVSVDENYMVVNIAYAPGADNTWQFMFRNAAYTPPAAETTDVTFTVNTSTIEVGANGMYLGGGIFGTSDAHAMTDADADGTWEVTLTLDEGTTGNYIFLNSPNGASDWGTKEVLTGQECADGQYDDRLLAPVGADDYTLQHCFGSCESDGTCPTEPAETTDVTFTVNTSTIEVGANGMYLGGGIIGDATAHAMTDADGDGTWEVTLTLDEGTTGNYIFLNSPNDGGDWGAKEVLTGQECADGQYDDRLLAPVGADDYTLQHCFGSCESDGSCPAPPSGDTCDHTFVMNDSYGDSWNGSSVDILVNGVVVVEGAAAANAGVNTGSTENLLFQAATGDVISLGNWVTGTYTTEVSWEILDNEGTSLASGNHGADASVDGYCTPPASCEGVTGSPAIADDFDSDSVDIFAYTNDNDVVTTVMDGASIGGSGNVLQYIDNGGTYANVQISTCNKFDMALTNTFTMDVYIDGASLSGSQTNQVAFKLQDGTQGAPWESQEVSVVTIDAVDTWQTVVFDFTGTAAMDRTDFDNVVIQFNGEGNNDTVTAYIDNLQSSNTLGIDDVNQISSFNFFPNPVNDVLTIKAQASIDSITVYNMLGQAVVRSTPNTTDSTVDMSALQTGAYFVQVSINNTVKTVRVIKN